MVAGKPRDAARDDPKQEYRKSETRYDLGIYLNEIATMIEPYEQSLLERVKDKDMRWHLKSIFNDDGTV